LGCGEKGKEEVGKSFPLSPFFFSPSFSFLYVGGGEWEERDKRTARNNVHVLFFNWRKSGRGNLSSFLCIFNHNKHTK